MRPIPFPWSKQRVYSSEVALVELVDGDLKLGGLKFYKNQDKLFLFSTDLWIPNGTLLSCLCLFSILVKLSILILCMVNSWPDLISKFNEIVKQFTQ